MSGGASSRAARTSTCLYVPIQSVFIIQDFYLLYKTDVVIKTSQNWTKQVQVKNLCLINTFWPKQDVWGGRGAEMPPTLAQPVLLIRSRHPTTKTHHRVKRQIESLSEHDPNDGASIRPQKTAVFLLYEVKKKTKTFPEQSCSSGKSAFF